VSLLVACAATAPPLLRQILDPNQSSTGPPCRPSGSWFMKHVMSSPSDPPGGARQPRRRMSQQHRGRVAAAESGAATRLDRLAEALLGVFCSDAVPGGRDGFADHQPVHTQVSDCAGEQVELDRFADVAVRADVERRSNDSGRSASCGDRSRRLFPLRDVGARGDAAGARRCCQRSEAELGQARSGPA
jgi:hypothetical protein